MVYSVVVAALLGVTPVADRADMACASTTKIVRLLTVKYDEHPVGGMAIRADGAGMQLFASDEKSTWSLVLIYPSGTACLLDAGDQWVPLPPGIPS